MRTTSLASVVLSFALIAVLIGGATAAASPNPQEMPDEPELSGVVTLNGDAAPAGIGITATLQDGSLCGSTTTVLEGQYDLVLEGECLESTVLFLLDVTGDAAVTETIVQKGSQVVTIAFEGLSTEALLSIGALQETIEEVAEEAAKETVQQLKGEQSLIRDRELFILLSILVAGELGLLGWMVWRLEKLTEKQGEQAVTYRRQIEAMVLLSVIVAVILLGVTEKIEGQGLVSVLSLIAGYAVGRTLAEGGQ